MDFVPVTEHIYQLEMKVDLLGFFPFSASIWLVKTDEGWLLIDCGFPIRPELVCVAIEKVTVGRGPSILILTHGHFDHVGCMEAVSKTWNPERLAHRL